jgi:hypothetical protein
MTNLIGFDKLAVSSNADGREYVVAGDHDGVDVGVVKGFDGRIRLLLHQVLHHDQAQKLSLLFQVRSYYEFQNFFFSNC